MLLMLTMFPTIFIVPFAGLFLLTFRLIFSGIILFNCLLPSFNLRLIFATGVFFFCLLDEIIQTIYN